MDTTYKQITGVIIHILTNYQKTVEDRKCINLQLSQNGKVQIDAIGSWVKNFCIPSFQVKQWYIEKDIAIYTGKNENNNPQQCHHIIKSKIEINETINTQDIYLDYDYYVGFMFEVEQQTVFMAFFKLASFFKSIAAKYPDVKMSFTGDVTLWQEKDEIERHINIISESIGEVMKYDTTLNFRDEVAMKYFKSGNRHVVVSRVFNTLKNLNF